MRPCAGLEQGLPMKSTKFGVPYVVFGALLFLALAQFDRSLLLVAVAAYLVGSMVVYALFEGFHYRASWPKIWGASALNAIWALGAALAYKLIMTGTL
jgi:hypothetical protein